MSTKPTYEELEKRVRELESAESELKRILDAPKQEENRYQNLFKHMLHEVHVWELVFDDNGHIKTWKLADANPAALKSWDKKLPEIVGKTTDEIFPDSNATELFMPIVEKIYREGTPHEWESYFPDTDQFLHMISISFGEYFISTGFDITERKRAEKVKETLEFQLRQSQKMEAVGTLAGGIAHDFNNILGIILGNTELAMDDVSDSNPARQNLDEVRKACMRAKDVVRQILSFSRKSKAEQKPLKIATVVAESLRLIRASIPTSIDIRQNISNNMGDIFGDSTQIHQIIINLCTNAAHSMENEGGILEVTLKNIEIDEDTTSQHPELDYGSYVNLRVSDTGDGISPDVIDRIFDPYFTTKDVGKGTGMGLAVVHGIVKSHHGKISVESKAGKGSVFDILFPAVRMGVKDEPTEPQELPTGNERILFVDDEKSMVNLNQQRLERLGYRVIPKTDPSEALEFFRTNPDQIDLIITDMTMPHMTGDKLAQEVLNIRSDMPIILCTGYSERMSEDMAHELGIRKYIEKPIGKETLAMSVRDVLDGK
jgi:signal transduction histidine kinase